MKNKYKLKGGNIFIENEFNLGRKEGTGENV